MLNQINRNIEIEIRLGFDSCSKFSFTDGSCNLIIIFEADMTIWAYLRIFITKIKIA